MEPWPTESFTDTDPRGLSRCRSARASHGSTKTSREVLGQPRNHSSSCDSSRAAIFQYDGDPKRCSQALEEIRPWLAERDALAQQWFYTLIYFQGVSAMRLGENENCILCRGESSCIVPINAAAVHTKPEGLARRHRVFHRIPRAVSRRHRGQVALERGPHDPGRVSRTGRSAIPARPDGFLHSQVDIGKFRDVGHLLGINRLNQAGGGIMDDFDGDGLLDIVVTTMDPAGADGDLPGTRATAHLRTAAKPPASPTSSADWFAIKPTTTTTAGWTSTFPAVRGFPTPCGPRCCATTAAGRFTDVTQDAGLLDPLNSNAAAWADYDNDGWLDLFVACEKQAQPALSQRARRHVSKRSPPKPVSTAKARTSSRAAPGSTTTTTGIPTCSSPA